MLTPDSGRVNGCRRDWKRIAFRLVNEWLDIHPIHPILAGGSKLGKFRFRKRFVIQDVCFAHGIQNDTIHIHRWLNGYGWVLILCPNRAAKQNKTQ